jgi:hypothetical protein
MNLGKTATSPRLNGQWVTVYRSIGSFQLGGWVETPHSPAFFRVWSVVSPANEKDLDQVPEGDRVVGGMIFHTRSELFITHNDQTPGTSDKLKWRNEMYRIIKIWPYIDYGYFKALGQRITGD